MYGHRVWTAPCNRFVGRGAGDGAWKIRKDERDLLLSEKKRRLAEELATLKFFSFAGWKLRGEHTQRGMGFERECGGDCGFVPVGEGERYRDGEQRVLMGRGCIALEHLGWHEDVVKASIQ